MVASSGTNVETPEEWMRGSWAARRRRVGANLVMIYLFLHGKVQLPEGLFEKG